MRSLVFLFVASLMLASCTKLEPRLLSSPDKNIQMRLLLENGKPYYEVKTGNKTLIEKSALGFELANQAELSSGFALKKSLHRSFDETWKPVYGQWEEISNHFNEVTWQLMETTELKRELWITARAYNDGVAFRYYFPAQNGITDSLFILAEKTEFRFSENHNSWWMPQDEFAYESLFQYSPLSQIEAANTPFTVHLTDGSYLSIHEAALLDYSEMTLAKHPSDSLAFISSLWPEPDGICARVQLPFQTPWRSILISPTAGGLIESSLTLNLNEPCVLEDVSWIEPMKFVGIWWGMHIGTYTWYEGPAHGATTERTKQYIDFAAQNGIEGVLAEGWNLGWETWATDQKNVQDFTTSYPDFDLEEVVRYAKERNVKFVSHHETGSNIPEYERQMEEAFALCQKLGINALKTGYAGMVSPQGYHHHGQYMVRHFQKVVETAARYKVMLNVHEGIKPTGLERTWPNLMTTEAIRGNEWNATYKATPPYHATILPFTRFLAGPADYTPGIFNIIHSPETNKRLYCTLAHQLALYVVMYSPMKMVSDMIENYENQAAFQFIKDVPASWHQTRVLEAVPGDYVVMARRKNLDWFLGAVADENSYELKIPLDFLGTHSNWLAQIYCDALETDWEHNPTAIQTESFMAKPSDTLHLALSKAGGAAIRFSPINKPDASSLQNITVFNAQSNAKTLAFENLKTYGNLSLQHLAKGLNPILKHNFSPLYPASGKQALTDGKTGSFNFSDGAWQGFHGVNMQATIDLEKAQAINEISVNFLHSPNDWIFMPQKVDFFVSNDGQAFQKVGEQKFEIRQPKIPHAVSIENASVKVNKKEVRFVRVLAHTSGKCPGWHYGRGQKSWMFVDEIIVK